MPDDRSIDAVVTWVDGNDPDLRNRRQQFLSPVAPDSQGSNQLAAGKHPSRFIDNGELRWCLSSIRKFAPWIGTIHLVTDHQKPDFLTDSRCAQMNIRLVDHTELFHGYEWALPTFNNRTIETALWRIPDLPEQFIYFNDDFVIMQPVQPEEFFQADSVLCRGCWKRIPRRGNWYWMVNQFYSTILLKLRGIPRTMHNLQQMYSAELAGFERSYFQVAHVPHPLKRSTLARFFSENDELFKENIRHRFRSVDQFSAVFLAYHLEIMDQKAILNPATDAYMLRRRILPGSTSMALSAIGGSRFKFLCLQSLESLNPGIRRRVEEKLNHLLPDW